MKEEREYMSNLLIKQFELTRGNLLKEINGIKQENVDVKPEGFNNTIHWQIGHILTVTEQFMFGFPKQTTFLPSNYIEWFGNGSKPADWGNEVPTVDTLATQLEDQLERIKKIPSERFREQLPKPFLGLETVSELASMALYHEANHLGQIHIINRMISK